MPKQETRAFAFTVPVHSCLILLGRRFRWKRESIEGITSVARPPDVDRLFPRCNFHRNYIIAGVGNVPCREIVLAVPLRAIPRRFCLHFFPTRGERGKVIEKGYSGREEHTGERERERRSGERHSAYYYEIPPTTSVIVSGIIKRQPLRTSSTISIHATIKIIAVFAFHSPRERIFIKIYDTARDRTNN